METTSTCCGLNSMTELRIESAARIDPLGPEPHSRAYWNLWKFEVRKWLLLNLLWAVRGKLWISIETGGFHRHKFAYTRGVTEVNPSAETVDLQFTGTEVQPPDRRQLPCG